MGKRAKKFLSNRQIEYEYIELASYSKTNAHTESSETKLKLWYCMQCGYVAFREDAPYICPICNAKKDEFEKILLHSYFLTT